MMNEDYDVFTPTVKNTFIDLQFFPSCTQPRRKSVPPSLRLCADAFSKPLSGLELTASVDTDASTDAHTDSSNYGEDGTASDFEVSTPRTPLTCEMCETCTFQPKQRLNAKASAFQPAQVQEEPAKFRFKQYFDDVIHSTKRALQDSGHAAGVEVSEDAGACFITIQTHAEDELIAERLLTIAKEALLDATSQSKSIYVMGFASPQPFTARSQGFEATLGAMMNATKACWHVFKKGFCRHGVDCCKEHPACEVPVQVLVESAQFNSSTRFVREFKQEVADLAMSVTATFRECAHVEAVEAFKDKDEEGWCVEVTSREEGAAHRDYLLAIAKNALFSATNNSNHVYIMGYAAKPFVPKANGFVAMLGDMQDEAKACWSLYSKGSCQMDCACRWEHPECLVPINIVIKASSPPSAVLDYLLSDEQPCIAYKR